MTLKAVMILDLLGNNRGKRVVILNPCCMGLDEIDDLLRSCDIPTHPTETLEKIGDQIRSNTNERMLRVKFRNQH
jgi:hypothetical protein